MYNPTQMQSDSSCCSESAFESISEVSVKIDPESPLGRMGKRIGIQRKSIKEFKLDKHFLRSSLYLSSQETVMSMQHKSFI